MDECFVKIPTKILEKMMSYRLSGEEWLIFNVLMRNTFGWHKEEDKISLTQFQQLTGINRKAVCRSLASLVSKKILGSVKKDTTHGNSYSINLNTDEWVVVSKKTPSVKNDTRTSVKNVPKVVSNLTHTIDNTKESIKEITTNVVRAKLDYGDPDINKIISYLKEKMELPDLDGGKWNRIYAKNLLKKSKTGLNGVLWLIDIASEDPWFKNKICSVKDLWNNKVKIVSSKRGEVSKYVDLTNV